MKSVLLIGSSGFIGSHIVSALCAQHKVTGIDVAPGRVEHANFSFVQERVTPALLQETIARLQPDYVVNAAGRASVYESFNDPATDFDENTLLTHRILDAMRRHAPGSKFIFLSSAAVYGNPLQLPVCETDVPSPISPYGFHKLQAENIAREFHQCFGVHSVGFRIFSCYGEGQRKLLLWDLCQKASVDKLVVLKGVGTESRDFIHVKDVALCIAYFVGAGFEGCELYNLASGAESSIVSVGTRLLECMNEDHSIMFEGIKNTGNPDNWVADVSKLKKKGFAGSIALEDGIAGYVEWFKSTAGHGK